MLVRGSCLNTILQKFEALSNMINYKGQVIWPAKPAVSQDKNPGIRNKAWVMSAKGLGEALHELQRC